MSVLTPEVNTVDYREVMAVGRDKRVRLGRRSTLRLSGRFHGVAKFYYHSGGGGRQISAIELDTAIPS